jgi:hypothetical protein
MRWPYRHSRARDEELVGGDGAIFAMEGTTVGICQLILAQTRLEVRLAQRQWEHSDSCIVAMVWIPAS